MRVMLVAGGPEAGERMVGLRGTWVVWHGGEHGVR